MLQQVQPEDIRDILAYLGENEASMYDDGGQTVRSESFWEMRKLLRYQKPKTMCDALFVKGQEVRIEKTVVQARSFLKQPTRVIHFFKGFPQKYTTCLDEIDRNIFVGLLVCGNDFRELVLSIAFFDKNESARETALILLRERDNRLMEDFYDDMSSLMVRKALVEIFPHKSKPLPGIKKQVPIIV